MIKEDSIKTNKTNKDDKVAQFVAGEVYTLEQILDFFNISEEEFEDACENNNGVIPLNSK